MKGLFKWHRNSALKNAAGVVCAIIGIGSARIYSWEIVLCGPLNLLQLVTSVSFSMAAAAIFVDFGKIAEMISYGEYVEEEEDSEEDDL